MRDTKEAILHTALRLFAKNGFEAVSVSQIAGELGMTKSALYKHYKNKQDIFNSIVARMEQMDAEQAGNFDLPEGTLEDMEEKYQTVSIKQFVEYSKVQFKYWTENDFASSFRKVLTLEQFRNAQMQHLYQQYLVAGPVGYVADLFGSLGIPEPKEQAAHFYGIMFFYYSMYDGAEDKKQITQQLQNALDRLVENIEKGLEY